MDSLYDTLSSGLSYLGDAVEKPGRAVRGVLAGKPREALAAVPFSDSLGLTDPGQRTTGRDLLDHYNLTTKGSDSFGSHAAGFAADIATDPLNAIAGVGAFKAAPTIAKGLKAGAKAFTGLDLADHIASGGRALAQGGRDLLAGEHGALSFPSFGFRSSAKVPPTSPLPLGFADPSLFSTRVTDPYHRTLFRKAGREDQPWWRAAHAANAEDIPITAIPEGTFARQYPKNPDVLAHYLGKDAGRIELNMGAIHEDALPGLDPRIWHDPQAMRDYMAQASTPGDPWLSSGHANHIIDHEIGHALHHQSLGESFYDMPRSGVTMTPQQQHTAGTVSRYATTNIPEFVAETYSGLRGGANLRHGDIPSFFKEYAGQPLLDRMQRSGLLRGLGLGTLGAAGLGAAYAASPTRSPATAY